jgi:hypothetical protein
MHLYLDKCSTLTLEQIEYLSNVDTCYVQDTTAKIVGSSKAVVCEKKEESSGSSDSDSDSDSDVVSFLLLAYLATFLLFNV